MNILLLSKAKIESRNPFNFSIKDYLQNDNFFGGFHSAFTELKHNVYFKFSSSYFCRFWLLSISSFFYRAFFYIIRKTPFLSKLDRHLLRNEIVNFVIRNDIDLIYTELNDFIDSKFTNLLKRKSAKKIKIAHWVGLFPEMLNPDFLNNLNKNDYILLPCDYIHLFDQYNIEHDKFIILGCSYNPLRLYQEKDAAFSHDVVFVGGVTAKHSDRIEVLNFLAGEYPGFRFYGYGENAEGVSNSLKSKYAGFANTEKLRKIFSSSKVAINLTLNNYEKVKSGINARSHEIPACHGAVQVAKYLDNYQDFFKQDEISLFKDLEGLKEIIDFFLQNEERRLEVADKAFERNKNFTYLKRAEKFIELVQDAR